MSTKYGLRFALGLGIVAMLCYSAPASADIVEAEVPAIDPADPAGSTNLSALLSGFVLVPPGQTLDVVNDSGASITGLAFTLTGTVAPADANGVLTCSSNQGFSACGVSSGAGSATDTTGPSLNASLSFPGSAPWAIFFTFANPLAAGGHFELTFRSFNAADSLSLVATPEPGTLTLLGSGIAGAWFWARRRFKSVPA